MADQSPVQDDNNPVVTNDGDQAIPAHLRTRCKVYTRVVGFIRPVDNWNDSKACEYKHRKVFSEKVAQKSADTLPV